MKQELKNLIETHLKQIKSDKQSVKQPQNKIDDFLVTPLSPDGSDRLYYRISSPQTAANFAPFIATDATGCREKDENSGLSQNNSFRLIQKHLAKLEFPVPGYITDATTGDDLYLLEDLGDTTLHDFVKTHGWSSNTIDLYRETLKLLLQLQIDAGKTFTPDWAYAGGFYDYELIVTRELNYFLEAFVINYCRIEITDATRNNLAEEFKHLSNTALQAPANFFLYRDFQSKNLMLYRNRIFLIDFQGARLGPYYYDIAALINDPYVEMPFHLRNDLQKFYLQKLELETSVDTTLPDPETFNFNFTLFSLIRTLQTLGAFGYLTGCGKKHFAQYIRPALTNFTYYLKQLQNYNADFGLNELNLISHKIKLWQNNSCNL